jgi:hypothetical protein
MSIILLLDSFIHRFRTRPELPKDAYVHTTISESANMAFNINEDAYMVATIDRTVYV